MLAFQMNQKYTFPIDLVLVSTRTTEGFPIKLLLIGTSHHVLVAIYYPLPHLQKVNNVNNSVCSHYGELRKLFNESFDFKSFVSAPCINGSLRKNND